MVETTHEYHAGVVWQGNEGQGTARYDSYGRGYRVMVAGKPDLEGSADPAFRGDAAKYNPEDLFLAAIAACHMLTYLALCARSGVRVVAYEDAASGSLRLQGGGGGGRFATVTLRPTVTIEDGDDRELAIRLHQAAQGQCFIASSCAVPIAHEVSVRTRSEGGLA